ncbi:DUF3892 domain-containing protein [Pseudomonas sp. R16(2017)]|uniref:DUF3892 domain-containing protein n=1 Tax=Pseudomonas sp. R16(2017) TaxID=1981704 RepID=UPI000A1DA6FE|nr:DUF3892 domain-containing protein [Pseudomonas sp. R16(2017)]
MQMYINQIRVSSQTGNITHVAAYEPRSSKVYWIPSEFIAQLINQGVPFNTRYKKGDIWVTGAKVEVVNGFLRTVANGTERDNLESLPTNKV